MEKIGGAQRENFEKKKTPDKKGRFGASFRKGVIVGKRPGKTDYLGQGKSRRFSTGGFRPEKCP